VRLLGRVREAIPGAALRSTFIVGFPGETEDEFEELLEFVSAARIAVGGVFAFDPQEGTPAAAYGPLVPGEVCRERVARLSKVLESAAAGYWSSLIGTEQTLLVERGQRHTLDDAVGRIAVQAPDIDGRTFVRGLRCRRGQRFRVRVDGVAGYDLIASVVGPQ
jgi:ribosomal protein S12 methylthiotransferase